MRTAFINQTITYTGLQLRSGWITDRTALQGDAAVAWLGPCLVPSAHLVDLDDARAGATIRSDLMLHFIIRVIEDDLERAVLRQRLTVATLASLLRPDSCLPVERRGDDLFLRDRKLTVSIATLGTSCSLIHLGINVHPGNAPVPAIGLSELSVQPRPLALDLLHLIASEHDQVRHALSKVRHVD